MPPFSTPLAATLRPEDAWKCVGWLRQLYKDWPDAVIVNICGDVVTAQPRPTTSFSSLLTLPANKGAEM